MKLKDLMKTIASDSSVIINFNDEIVFEEICYFYYELNDKFDDHEVYNIGVQEDDCGIYFMMALWQKECKFFKEL